MSRARLKSKITAFKTKPVTSLVKKRRRPQAEPAQTNGAPVPLLSTSEDELQVRIRELIKLAKEQGYLTFDDLNEALPDAMTDAEVTVLAGSRLADALGVTQCSVRSHHHQCVDDLSPKATATAWAGDGVLEGFELSESWVVAVQWHPEVTAADDPIQQRLFDAFVAEAAR